MDFHNSPELENNILVETVSTVGPLGFFFSFLFFTNQKSSSKIKKQLLKREGFLIIRPTHTHARARTPPAFMTAVLHLLPLAEKKKKKITIQSNVKYIIEIPHKTKSFSFMRIRANAFSSVSVLTSLGEPELNVCVKCQTHS